MVDLVPPAARQAFTVQSDSVLVEPVGATLESPDALSLHLVRNKQESGLGQYPCDPTGFAEARRAAAIPGNKVAIRLRIPADILLQKDLSLPLGAERDLRQVLRYEMDRFTPFSADEVWWDFAILKRDKARAKLEARLWLVPKPFLAPLLDRLQANGLMVSALETQPKRGASQAIQLAASTHRSTRWLTRAVPLTAIGCAVLALIAIVLPFVRQSYQYSTASERIAALKPAVDEVEMLRHRLTGGGASDLLKAERERVGDALTVLAAATRILPNDTYLTDFTMQQRRLTLNGQAIGPAKLIPALAADPTFQDPALGTSTHAEGSPTDVFSITAVAKP